MTRSVALFLAMLLGLAACGDDSASTTSSSTTTTTTTTTAPAPSTTALPTGLQPSAEEAAGAFVDAWANGDHATALAVAVPAAVDAVWATSPGSTQARGCNEPVGDVPVRCVYRTDAGELILQVTDSHVAGWYVSLASLSPAE